MAVSGVTRVLNPELMAFDAMGFGGDAQVVICITSIGIGYSMPTVRGPLGKTVLTTIFSRFYIFADFRGGIVFIDLLWDTVTG